MLPNQSQCILSHDTHVSFILTITESHYNNCIPGSLPVNFGFLCATEKSRPQINVVTTSKSFYSNISYR
jgi:hypothetical protein